MNSAAIHQEISSHLVFSGYLLKKAKFFNEWRKRWVVLTHNFVFTFRQKPVFSAKHTLSSQDFQLTESIEIRNIRSVKSFLHPYNSQRVYNQEQGSSAFKIDGTDLSFHFRAFQIGDKWEWLNHIERAVTKMDYQSGQLPRSSSARLPYFSVNSSAASTAHPSSPSSHDISALSKKMSSTTTQTQQSIEQDEFPVQKHQAFNSNCNNNNQSSRHRHKVSSSNFSNTQIVENSFDCLQALRNSGKIQTQKKQEAQNQWTQTYEQDFMVQANPQFPELLTRSMRKIRRKVMVFEGSSEVSSSKKNKMYLVRSLFDEYGSTINNIVQCQNACKQVYRFISPEVLDFDSPTSNSQQQLSRGYFDQEQKARWKKSQKYYAQILMNYFFQAEELGLRDSILLELRVHKDRKLIIHSLIEQAVETTASHLLKECRQSSMHRIVYQGQKMSRRHTSASCLHAPDNSSHSAIPQHIESTLKIALELFKQLLTDSEISGGLGTSELEEIRNYGLSIIETVFIRSEVVLERTVELLGIVRKMKRVWGAQEQQRVKKIRGVLERCYDGEGLSVLYQTK